MTTFQIKLCAFLFMLIDHVGLFFFPQSFYFRMIGRLSFPLFAWLIANGARHTKNRKKYLIRLVAFGIASQVPFVWALRQAGVTTIGFNIFFTLSIGLAVIIVIQKTKNIFFGMIAFLLACSISTVFSVDYGWFGIATIILSYVFFTSFWLLLIAQSLLFVSFSSIGLLTHNAVDIVTVVGLFSFLIIYFYNKKKGSAKQWLLYLIYPIHFIILGLVKLFL